MKLQTLSAALAAFLAAPAMAAGADEPEPMSIPEVSQLTGVSQSDLRVLFGAHSTPGVYPMNYYIAQRDYRDAVQRIRDQGLALSFEDDGVRIVRLAGPDAPVATRAEDIL